MGIASVPGAMARRSATLVVAALLGACGGGGGDDVVVDTDDPAPSLPTIVKFGIGTKATAPLTVTATGVGVVAYPSLGFNGEWNRAASAFTLGGGTGVSSGATLYGDMTERIAEPLRWVAAPEPWIGDNIPTEGKLETETPLSNTNFPGYLVQTAISSTGLTLSYQSSTLALPDWGAFEDLWEDPATPAEWQLASFGGSTLSLAIDRSRLVLDLMAYVNARDREIAAAGAAGIEAPCDLPPGSTTRGSRKIALANPDGQLNPGDSLVMTYTDCWLDDPGDNVDIWLEGTVVLSGYIENADDSGALVSTGFDEFRFESLKSRDTETVGGALIPDDLELVTTGTMTLFVTP